ncbi:MAG: porin family protein [Gammaproteobacteria bacterium]|nr:porin family protein [Gammaproteobacteria bacterium]
MEKTMLRMHIKLLFSFIIFSFCLSNSYATENVLDTHSIPLLNSSFVVSLSAGPSWERAGEAQTLDLTPAIIKTYTANKPLNRLPNGELFLGIQNSLITHLIEQIGLSMAAAGHATLSGDIWDDGDPLFNNYTYKYEVIHKAILLKAKVLGNWNWPVMPWISASAGEGFNRAYGFTNTPTVEEAVIMPNFASKMIKTFTYTLGVGLQRALNPHWQVGIGYEFSDWGRSQLGSAEGSNHGITLYHLYTHSALINLTYNT